MAVRLITRIAPWLPSHLPGEFSNVTKIIFDATGSKRSFLVSDSLSINLSVYTFSKRVALTKKVIPDFGYSLPPSGIHLTSCPPFLV